MTSASLSLAPRVALYLGDCFDILPRLPAEDYVIVTDPPFTIRTFQDCEDMLHRMLPITCEETLVLTNPEHGYIWRGDKVLVPKLAPTPTAAHPHQRPIDEMMKLVAMTQIGAGAHADVVLDPYAGSGTTLLAAMLLGMRAVGVERDPNYWLEFCSSVAKNSRGVPIAKVCF
jgi:DNA methylase